MAVSFSSETMTRSGALYVDYPENILIDPELNGRHELPDIEELAADIEAHGQYTPVVVRKNDAGQAVLVYGHRRWRALLLLNERNPDNKRKITCNYVALTEAEAFAAAIGENRFRKDVSPIDDAENIRIMRQRFAKSDEDIAAIYFPQAKTDEAKTEALRFVKQRAALIELAPEAAQAVRDGRVKITAAVHLAKLSRDQQKVVVSKGGRVKGKDINPVTPKVTTPDTNVTPEDPAFEFSDYLVKILTDNENTLDWEEVNLLTKKYIKARGKAYRDSLKNVAATDNELVA